MEEPVRLDKWLWAARLYKTRALASGDIALGRMSVNGTPAKASRELRIGDRVALRRAGPPTEVEVLGLSSRRGPAAVAQTLYRETPGSIAERERRAAARAAPDPAVAGSRPTRHDRRQLAAWERWSASIDD